MQYFKRQERHLCLLGAQVKYREQLAEGFSRTIFALLPACITALVRNASRRAIMPT